MTIEHKIKIIELIVVDKEENLDIVSSVHWRLTSLDTETGKEARLAYMSDIKRNEQMSFVPFAEITEELVMIWIQENLRRENNEMYLASKIILSDEEKQDPFFLLKKKNEEKLNFAPPPAKREKKAPWQ